MNDNVINMYPIQKEEVNVGVPVNLTNTKDITLNKTKKTAQIAK